MEINKWTCRSEEREIEGVSAEGDCLSKAYAEAFLEILTLAKEVCGV